MTLFSLLEDKVGPGVVITFRNVTNFLALKTANGVFK